MFSLEDDDDYGDIFITQTPKKVNEVVMEEKDLNESVDYEFLGVKSTDFASPCTSLVGRSALSVCDYSDISDDEMPPSSQMHCIVEPKR